MRDLISAYFLTDVNSSFPSLFRYCMNRILAKSLHCSKTIFMEPPASTEEIYLALGLTENDSEENYPLVLDILTSLLEKTVEKNEMLLSAQSEEIDDDVMADFYTPEPTMTIGYYLDQIFSYAKCSASCFVGAYIYMDKFLQRNNGYLTFHNVHKLLLISLLLAIKVLEDRFYKNDYYAKAGGIDTSELNSLEIKMLLDFDFRLHITTETFREYCLKFERVAVEDACGKNW